MPGEKDKIYPETPHLILCEGLDAHNFLIWFLDFLKKESGEFNAFRVYDFGGITELKNYLRIITKTDGFKKIVKSICIIRDAETDVDGACQSIQNILKNSGFAVPKKPCSWENNGSAAYPKIMTGFLLFPSCDQNPRKGTLEDLCLDILAKENAVSVLEDADTALAKHKFKRIHKNRLHAYFSLTDEFVSLKIGEAAKTGAFSFHGPKIDSLKSFLLEMHKYSGENNIRR